jgi:DNA-binding response OmpR family regulator
MDTSAMRILVIEDELRMLELLRLGLHEHGCAVMTALDGETGLQIAATCEFEVVILDIGLPGCDGFEVLQTLKQRHSAARILMLTARDAEDEIIRGLDLGADDYMTKPFSFLELTARLQSVSRAPRGVTDTRIEVRDLVVDTIRRTVVRDHQTVALSRSEFSLLASLLRAAGHCVSRESLTKAIWGPGANVGAGALDVLVNALRAKVDSPYQHKLIHTVRGSGYRIDPGVRDEALPLQGGRA